MPKKQSRAVPPAAEQARLDEVREGKAAWRKWGPYLADRAWGTVREDYSADGRAWDYFPHDHARSRIYRWNEDGLAGISDDQQYLCFGLALWNGKDPILKERLFGLTGNEGNHGEDVKEAYFYLDSTPTHSYMKMLYKYPQRAFPYDDLVATNRMRGKQEPEYELFDTGVFDEDRYFDIFVEYAKAGPEDLLIRITVANRGAEPATLHLLPQLWFRNTWRWGGEEARLGKPGLKQIGTGQIEAQHAALGRLTLQAEGQPTLLFTENESNQKRLYGIENGSPYVTDAFHELLIKGRAEAVNPAGVGTKAAAHYTLNIGPGASEVIRLRLGKELPAEPFADFEALFAARLAEADAFYAAIQPATLTDDEKLVQRQAFGGMLWSKQFYHFDVDQWLRGDPGLPAPPPERLRGRNREWRHLNTRDILSMPDKWEYPWFAAWDLAFHCVVLALIDPDFAKHQLILMGREWYQHPNGQTPAYEWAYGDVNPPVLAWAVKRVYEIEKARTGKGDLLFLERAYHKLLLNFTWWVNRKDVEGNNVFEGGFLGLDNIGVFDRSAPLPIGQRMEQSDGTSWMGMFSLNMLSIALELAQHNPAYEDIATKFFEHFLYIAAAMNNLGGEGIALWDEQDEFFYDVLHLGPAQSMQLKVRSMVGLIPLFAVTTLEPEVLARLPAFTRHLNWFMENRPDLEALVSRWHEPGLGERRLLAILRGSRMKRVLRRMLDESEFLSPYGVRALSRYHREKPFMMEINGHHHIVEYQPGESTTYMFGGNSNWRGPIWFPVNHLIIESLLAFDQYYTDDFKVECPTGSGQMRTLTGASNLIAERLIAIFLRDPMGRRPVFGDRTLFHTDPHWRDYVPFYEYFHGDHGAGLGASHQTGWTGLVALLIQQAGERRAAG